MKIGYVLKSYRKDKRMKLTEMAELIGVSDRGLRKWELGKSIPAPEYLRMITEATGIDYLYLMICAGHIDRQDIANHKAWVEGMKRMGVSL